MGEVWKARDTRLRREVAIKTLPGDLARQPGLLARLEREAELLATLNHPHIATIHGLEEQAGARFLVLELVEGSTLEERISRGALPIDEAITIALQLAQALEAAHARGIIHRDLKPANIKITPDRRVKVLDFGIAKAIAGADANDETVETDPTRTGAVIGTPAYMGPEQARGEPVGVQADIWSFGAVLYEMLTGLSPFRRKTTAETIASVLESQPDFSSLPQSAPAIIGNLVRRCLEKERSRRLQHMGDVRILLEESMTSSGGHPATNGRSMSNRRGAWISAAVVASALLLATVPWVTGLRSTGAAPASALRVSIPFLGRPGVDPFGVRHVAISPDGSQLAFAADDRLWVRRMDQKDAVAVVTGRNNNPFFSPDGEWVGVFVDTALVKVPTRGGTVVTITATDRPAGGTWGSDGTIVFATSEALYEVPASGGERKVLIAPDRSRKELLYAWPHFLAGSRALLFTLVSEDRNQAPQIVLLDLKTRERKTLLPGAAAVYAQGYLIFVADQALKAVAFDEATGVVTGKPISLSDVEVTVSPDNAAANFAASANGTLIVSPPAQAALRGLEWIDRHGNRERLAVEPQTYGYPTVSPDGTRVAVERTTRGNRDIWILDLKRLTQTQLTDGPTEDMLPTWSPDSKRVFFASRRTGNFDVYSQSADGASGAKLEFAGDDFQVPSAVTPDGRKLIVYDRFQDLRVLDFAAPSRLEPLLQSGFDERLGQVSPDGRWIVYESDESGNQFEIVLRSFPNVSERREVVSVGGGRFPRWGPVGSNEIYYVRPDGAMMAVSVKLSPTVVLGETKKLFDWQKPPEGRAAQLYDVAPDGRFLVTSASTPTAERATNVSVIMNWLALLRASR